MGVRRRKYGLKSRFNVFIYVMEYVVTRYQRFMARSGGDRMGGDGDHYFSGLPDVEKKKRRNLNSVLNSKV